MTALRTRPRRLMDADLAALRRLLSCEPLGNCALIARLDMTRSLGPRELGGTVWAGEDPQRPGELSAACFVGGSVLPIGPSVDGLRMLAAELATQPRNCSSIVGTSSAVSALWSVLHDSWGPAREDRPRQPLLSSGSVPAVAGDPAVRVVRRAEFEGYLPAARAMFGEEVGVDPSQERDAAAFARQLQRFITEGRALARFDADGQVIFKAEIAVITGSCAQIQGVWVAPHWRRRGIGTAATAAVIEHALRLAPLACLYVNEYNHAARRMYARLGMAEVGCMSTVLF